ncbi:MAG: 50S ribosomal protein L11 methyltransferase [Rikenellaceae bacterium]|nr:50S ribosomal protein L11 methyltransferase [Rikenellaceae bacterium]
MKYVELNIAVADSMQAEILTALLSDYPFEAFAEEEGALKAYILDSDYTECSQEVEQLLLSQDVEFEVIEVVQQNWNAEWESGFEPVEVTGEKPIRIRAPHHSPAEEGVMDVVIAPRMSFGTGHHATTALMSQTIASEGVEGLRGLDMGCGTGVLAIVALKCGAEHMVAVDIDDWACDSCRDSIALSGVAEWVDVRCGSIEQVVAGEQFDFILANINRNILISMMPSFAAALPSGGRLLMSGFLREDVVYIEASAVEQGFEVVNIIEREGWMVVVCKKM